MRKAVWSRLTAVALAAVLLVGMGVYDRPTPVEAASRGELENQLKNLEAQEKKIKSDLAAASSDLSASKKRKELLDAQIKNATQQINLLDEQLSTLTTKLVNKNKQIQGAESEIEAKEEAIETTRDEMGLRLRTVAKTGNLSALQRLLNAESFRDYLLQTKAAEYISKHDRQVMDQLETEVRDIQERKAELQKQKDEVSAQRAQVQSLKDKSAKKKKELNTLHQAVQTEISKLQSNVSDYNSDLKETQRKIAAADAAIEALIKGSASTGTFNGEMMHWPVPTVRAISSHFGPRWGTMHRGLDIANGPIPIYGENIVAAADGVVIAVNSSSWYGSGWSYGYGYCVIIDHGKDSRGRTIHTMYAHCSAMYARVGQRVTGGKTVIAKAGNSGQVTGPHLHFEVRVNGERVNPYPNYVHPSVN